MSIPPHRESQLPGLPTQSPVCQQCFVGPLFYRRNNGPMADPELVQCGSCGSQYHQSCCLNGTCPHCASQNFRPYTHENAIRPRRVRRSRSTSRKPRLVVFNCYNISYTLLTAEDPSHYDGLRAISRVSRHGFALLRSLSVSAQSWLETRLNGAAESLSTTKNWRWLAGLLKRYAHPLAWLLLVVGMMLALQSSCASLRSFIAEVDP